MDRCGNRQGAKSPRSLRVLRGETAVGLGGPECLGFDLPSDVLEVGLHFILTSGIRCCLCPRILHSLEFRSFFLNLSPGLMHMVRLGMGLGDTEPKDILIVQCCVRQIEIPALIKTVQ